MHLVTLLKLQFRIKIDIKVPMMRGKRRNPNENKARSKKIKRSKAFWQQRKTNTISQVQESESGSELEDICPDAEPTTQYQKLLETYSQNAVSSEKLVSDSENEDGEQLDSEAGNCNHYFLFAFLE